MTVRFFSRILTGVLLIATVAAANADKNADEAVLKQLTLEWVAGWRTSPEQPFTLDQIAHLYAQDDRLMSFDFGRPAAGVSGWAQASRYYEQFMAIPETWALTANDDLRVFLRDDIAWSTVSLAGRGTLADGSVIDAPESRVTLIFERRDDQWLIVHEHGSVALPFPDQATVETMLSD